MKWNGNTYSFMRNPAGRNHLEDLCIDGRIIQTKEIGWQVVDWIHPAQDRNDWQAVVDMVMNH